MGCIPSSQPNVNANGVSSSDPNWLNRPKEGYHWEQNKVQNTTSKSDGLKSSSNERDGTGVEGYVAAESYGGVDGMGAACGAGGCGGCGGCGG